MDLEYLNAISSGPALTASVFADDIGRSPEAVSRRLNTLEAGGLVERVDRGKYRITREAVTLM